MDLPYSPALFYLTSALLQQIGGPCFNLGDLESHSELAGTGFHSLSTSLHELSGAVEVQTEP